MHTYAEIPDTMRTKAFLPFNRHLWKVYQELGLEYYENTLDRISDVLMFDVISSRLDVTIKTAGAVFNGEIEQPDKVLSYLLFPPVLPIRGDLSQGGLKLVYGDSCDITFVICDDINQEVLLLLNGHCEDGIPVDWWLIGQDDETMERRHQKYGYKLKEMPGRFKKFFDTGEKLTDILKDIRNERTPQWAKSSYIVCMVWGSALLNLLEECSNFEQFGTIWDAANPKKYGLPDKYFGYIPWTATLNMLMVGGRNKWTMGLTGITTGHHAYFMPLEEAGRDWIKENIPEFWEKGFLDARAEGMPYPWQSLGVTIPNFKKKSTYENEAFDYKYPSGDWITPEALGLTPEETCQGVYLDVKPQTPKNEKVNKSHILSMGIGIDTEFMS